MPNRRRDVIAFPQPIQNVDKSVYEALEEVRAHLGLITSLLVIPLLVSEAGLGTTAAVAGTVIVQANDTLDLEDARINQVRLSGHANSSGGGDTVRLKQGSTILCTANVPTGGAARFAGSWASVRLNGGDLPYTLEVVGNAIRTQTLHRVTLHARTL